MNFLKTITSILPSLHYGQTSVKYQLAMYVLCLLVVSQIAKDQSYEVKEKIPKLLRFKTFRSSEEPVLYYKNFSATQRLIILGTLQRNHPRIEGYLKKSYGRLKEKLELKFARMRKSHQEKQWVFNACNH